MMASDVNVDTQALVWSGRYWPTESHYTYLFDAIREEVADIVKLLTAPAEGVAPLEENDRKLRERNRPKECNCNSFVRWGTHAWNCPGKAALTASPEETT